MRKLLYGLFVLMMASCANNMVSEENSVKNNTSNADVVEEVIMSRRSIRKYTDQALSTDTLDKIMRCGINAPNGRNRQAYEVRVVNNKALVNEISDAVVAGQPDFKKQDGFKNVFANATCVVFIAADTTYDMSQVDCGLLGENIMLSAWSMGIGSCCMAHPVRLMKQTEGCAGYIQKLGFSEGYNLLYCIAMGYPDETPDAKPRLSEKVKFVD